MNHEPHKKHELFYEVYLCYLFLKNGRFGIVNHESDEEILFKDECYRIQGAIYEVNREMGIL